MATGRIPINGTAAIQSTIVDAKGDLIAGTGSDAVARLAVGANGTTLVADSAETTGLKWVTPASGATFSGASATKSASQSTTSGTWTIVSFNTEQFDVDGYHDNVTNNSRFTIPTGKNGYFLVHGALQWVANSGGNRQIALVKNGTDLIVRQDAASSGTYPASRQFTCIINAVATDYFEINSRQDSGGALNLDGGSDACRFSITYLGA